MSAVRRCARALIGLLAVFGCLGMEQMSQAQLPFQMQVNNEDLFLLAPRPLTRILREGEIAFEEGRYADGIAALSQLLVADSDEVPEDLRGQDFFLEPGPRGLYDKSIKAEAIRLLSELPPEGRRTLQIQLGVTAERELADAVADRDFERIGDVARKYPHTDAGYDALVLIAQYKMTTGYPLAAAALLKDLTRYQPARERYGPQLAWATACAWTLAGNMEAGSLTLKLASRDYPGASLEIQGQQVPLSVETDWSSWLERVRLRDTTFVDLTADDAWLVTGGGPERNAVAEAGMPLPTERWMREIHSSLPEQQALVQQRESETRKGKVLLPKFELRMVGDLVLTKTTNASLLAIDFSTGVIKWPCFFNNVPAQLTNSPFRSSGGSADSVSKELQTRVWGSSAFGKFSCDEQRLYFVSDPTDRLLSSENIYRGNRRTDDVNYLEGAGFEAEGTILWRVGGEDGVDEPQLAGSYFLGPPLPYQGELYCLAEVNGETLLVVLDAASGELRWKQQLVHPSTSLLYDAERRSQALSPTIAEGVILCPTGVGAVVAVDLLSRSLRWGATYTTSNRSIYGGGLRQRGAFGDGSEFSALDSRWQEPALIAQDGVVLISPPESDYMFCRDILTGAPKLAPQQRNSSRYLAGLRNGKIISVGERRVTAFELGSGDPVWDCQFPDGLTLAGKGLWQANSMLLPLSERTVIRVDTEDGQITDRVQVAQPLGNLFAHKDQLLSVSESAVTVYYTRDALAKQVDQRLSDNADDIWALNQQSQLAMFEGDLGQAVESLTKSYGLDSENADTRYLLVEVLLRGLATDFQKFEPLAQRYSEVVEFGPQRFRFLQQLALGKLRSGKHLVAFESLLELVPRTGGTFAVTQNRRRELELEAGYTVDSDAWIATELSRCYGRADDNERQAMNRLIASEIASVQDTLVPLRREKLRFLKWLPAAAEPLLALSAQLLGGEEQTIAEHLLQPLLLNTSEQFETRARALLARPAAADRRFGGLSLDDSPFGSRAMSAQDGTTDEATSRQATLVNVDDFWNRGRVLMDTSDESRYHFGAVVDVQAERYGRPDLSIALSGSTVVVRSATGEDRAHLEFPRASSDAPESLAQATVRGGLLLLETSSEIVAFDMVRGMASGGDALLWRHSLFNPGAGPSREYSVPEISSINTPFGFALSRRQMPDNQQAIVGPLTPAGIVIQVGTKVMLLDALSGLAVWSRDGYDDRLRLVAHGMHVGIVNPSLGQVEILDCRDGAQLTRHEYRGDWRHWFSYNGTLVDFSETPTVPPGPSTMRVWNAITGQEIKQMELPVGTRADVCDGRYLVVLEPTGKLHYFDLHNPSDVIVTETQVELPHRLDSISAQRFGDRVLVFTSSSKSRSQATDFVALNGIVISLDTQTGQQSWPRPGKLHDLQFPLSQPRQSPFMVAYRVDLDSGDHRATLALVDLRSGRLAYSSKSLPLRAGVGFAMTLRPDEQTIELGLGARSMRFSITDQPRPPSPIFSFGRRPTRPKPDPGFDIFGTPR